MHHSAFQFLELFLESVRKDWHLEKDHFFLAQYFAESTLLDTKFLKFKQSEIAAGSLYLLLYSMKFFHPRVADGELSWPSWVGERHCAELVAREIFGQVWTLRMRKGCYLDVKYSNRETMEQIQIPSELHLGDSGVTLRPMTVCWRRILVDWLISLHTHPCQNYVQETL